MRVIKPIPKSIIEHRDWGSGTSIDTFQQANTACLEILQRCGQQQQKNEQVG